MNNQLRVNKNSLNVQKFELVIYKISTKVLFAEIKHNLCGKRSYSSNPVKYFGVRVDRLLHWHDLANAITVNVTKANALLHKIRNYVIMKTLTHICFAIFDSHLSYSYFVWAQNIYTVNRFIILQKKVRYV